jgi:hypothetical protein
MFDYALLRGGVVFTPSLAAATLCDPEVYEIYSPQYVHSFVSSSLVFDK